jgi:hypothetical protein
MPRGSGRGMEHPALAISIWCSLALTIPTNDRVGRCADLCRAIRR